MNTLYEIELIKQLKARYFRTLDTNEWTGFGQCLTVDCKARYRGGKWSFDSRSEIVGFMKEHMSAETLLSMHTGHHPEISVDKNGVTAVGTWYLHDVIINIEHRTILTGAAIYADEYRKDSGEWRISKTGYERTFECLEPLHEKHRILHNMFAG